MTLIIKYFIDFDRLLESSKRIRDYGLADGSRVALVPSVETGLLVSFLKQQISIIFMSVYLNSVYV